ncbi:hypothetical protein [Candidatus Nitrosocosmicus sp. T]
MRLITPDGSFNDDAIAKIADAATNTYFSRDSMAVRKWGETGKRHTYEDTVRTLKQLAIAVYLNEMNIFTDYISWLSIVLQSRYISKDVIINHTKILIDIFQLDLEKLNNVEESYIEEMKLLQLYLKYLDQGLKTIEKQGNGRKNGITKVHSS